MEELTWRRSTRSGTTGGNCVEVAELPGKVLVRDSKDKAGPVLAVSPAEFRKFIASLR